MMAFGRRAAAMLVVLIAAALVSSCDGLPKDGRYQTHGGGWDNFRG